ncbi:FAD binding domain-containing protein [Spirillospora sp. NPDC048911]|uniref:FAD binding domain-containing protein n=1 Tax=Spirillospora sp. NPDC048911 TaxID=3364527 RepID=UPI00371472A3
MEFVRATDWRRALEVKAGGAGVLPVAGGTDVMVEELGGLLPGLAQAARTVGSRQIRNRGTLGGNLGTAANKGVCHPLLLACDARIEVASVSGVRMIAAEHFLSAWRAHCVASR